MINYNEGKNEYNIKSYNAEECEGDIKIKFNEFIKYHNTIKQKIFEIENNSNKTKLDNKEDNNINNISENNSIYIDNSTNNNISINNSKEKVKQLIYIKNFIKEKYAKFFTLSDGTTHVIFKDQTEIIIENNKNIFGYVDKNKKRTFIPLINIMNNSNQELKKRLKYIRYINYKTVKKNIKIKNGELDNKEEKKHKENEGNKEHSNSYDEDNYFI